MNVNNNNVGRSDPQPPNLGGSSDLIIIGAGPGGYRAAEYAAKQGLKVVIFEGSEVGGTCLNVGCIPTKTYVHSATFDEARSRMAQVVPQLRQGVETILSHPNITLVREVGKTLPKRLTIIGAGVIGMEFASVFRRFGSEVTVIEYLKECLPALDSDIAKRLRKYLEKQGITFKMKTAVENIADIDADVILMATGRKPRTEGYTNVDENFQVLTVPEPAERAVPVERTVPEPVEGLYAIGDVNGRQMLAHAAEMQAVRAVNHILGKKDNIRFDIMPAAIFTEPEAACVGPTEDQLKASGTAYTCKKSFWRANGKALAMNATEGMLKLFVSPADEILGCHAYGAHAADIVQEVSVLMCKHTTLSELTDMVHIHPTLSEILKSAAEA